jgi:hypothetical protein
MATTLEQITTEFYNIVNATPDNGSGKNTVYTLDFVQNLANTVQRDVCLAWDFPFTRKKSLTTTAFETTASNAIAISDIIITIPSTSSFAVSGALWIEHDIVNYTGKTTTTFTGVTNIDVAHNEGSIIEPLYAMPTDFAENMSVWVGATSNSKLKEYRYIPYDEFDKSSQTLVWTIVVDKTGVEYIRVNNPSNTEIISFEYNKFPATMTDVINATIPDQFALSVIPRIMAGTAMIIRDDNPDDLGRIISQVGEKDRMRMKNYYSSRMGILSVPFVSKYKPRLPVSSYRINRTYGSN